MWPHGQCVIQGKRISATVKKNVLDDFIFHNSDLFVFFFKSEKDVEIPT